MLAMGEQIKWFPDTGSTLDEDVANIIKMTTKDQALHKFSWIKSSRIWQDWLNFENSSIVGEMLPNSIACQRKIVSERVSQCGKTRWSVSSHEGQGMILHQQKDYNSFQSQIMVIIF